MAIIPEAFKFLLIAHERKLLAPVKDILEFGESEVMLNTADALKLLGLPEATLQARLAELQTVRATAGPRQNFDEARVLYNGLFGAHDYHAIDLSDGPYTIKQDLNVAFDLARQFDVCINNGTSEHVFDQANFYISMHKHTRVGGLMIHFTPCLGWINHGLYNVQPGFFFDLARDNDYEMLLAGFTTPKAIYTLKPEGVTEKVLQEHPDLRNANAAVVMRKRSAAPFKAPLQGAYLTLRQ